MKRLLVLIFLFGCKESKRDSYPEGGFAYPTNINPRDSGFYFYPLVDSFHAADSASWVFTSRYTMPQYNEANISLRPQKQDVFRLTYTNAFGRTAFFTITQNEIVTKLNGKEHPYNSWFLGDDTMRLTPVERVDYEFFRWFPLQDHLDTSKDYNKKRFKYFDSLVKKRPQLLSTAYFVQLTEKVMLPITKKLEYIEKRQPISLKQYQDWISLLNHSGYWAMPFDITNKESGGADGTLIFLEANTFNQYKFVERNFDGLKQFSSFETVCDSLISLSGMKELL